MNDQARFKLLTPEDQAIARRFSLFMTADFRDAEIMIIRTCETLRRQNGSNRFERKPPRRR